MTTTLEVIQPADELISYVSQARAGLSIASRDIAQRRPLAELVKATITAAARSTHTARAYRRAIGEFITLLGEVRFNGWPLVERVEAGQHKATTYDYGNTPAAVLLLVDAPILDRFGKQDRQGLHAVKTFLSVAYRDNVLTDDQARAMGLKPYQPKVKRDAPPVGRRLSPMEVQILRAAVDTSTISGRRDRAILDIMLFCGLRREEVANLDLSDFGQDSGRWAITFKGKGDKRRKLFIPAPLFNSLSAWLEDYGKVLGESGALFVSIRKGERLQTARLTSQAISDIVANYGAGAGLAPIRGDHRLTAHDLRRTMARRAYDLGAGLPAIQLALGHSDPKTTARYIGLDTEAGATVTDLVRYE